MKGKKLLSILLSLLLVMTLFSGCKTSDETDQKPVETSAQETKLASAEVDTKEETKNESKVEIDEKFPEKPITWIIQAGPGGGLDTTARVLAKVVQKSISQNIAITNVEGGGGAVGITQFSQSKADGYTLGLIHQTVLLDEHLREGISYTADSFEPIVQINYDPAMLIVKKGSDYDVSIDEFIKKAQSKDVNMAIAGLWLPTEFCRLFLIDKTGAKFPRIGFEGSGATAAAAVLSGDVDCAIVLPSEWSSYYKAGEMVGLAVNSDKRLDAFPDVPTFKELGIEIPTTGIRRVLAVPKGTDDKVVNRLEEIFMTALKDPELKEAYNEIGLEPNPMPRAEAKEALLSETNSYVDIIKKLGIQKGDTPQ